MKNLFKYPQTMHLPWSQSITSDDCWLEDCTHFMGKQVVVTEKLDGENTNMYRDHIHARSRDSVHHPSRSWVKQLHASISHEIPEGWRICGENLFAYHSIWYWDLPSYFFVFGIYDEKNRCLPWDEVEGYASMLGLATAPVLYRGDWSDLSLKDLVLNGPKGVVWDNKSAFPTYYITEKNYADNMKSTYVPSTGEGYVVRMQDGFHFDDFKKTTAKFVRASHVQTDGFWMTQPVIPNLLLEGLA